MMIAAAAASAMELGACLISAVQLIRHRNEQRDYTRIFLSCCAAYFVLTSAFIVVSICLHPMDNLYSTRLHPVLILFGLLAQILALVYPLCVIRPGEYSPFAFMFVPWVVLALMFVLIPSWTPIYSLDDLINDMGASNVIIRLVAVGFNAPYLVYLGYLLMPGTRNVVSVSRFYFWGYGISTLIVVALHFLFLFTGELIFQILHQILLGAFFYIVTLFDLEVRLYPEEAVEEEPVKEAPEQMERSLEYVSRPLWERICQALDKEEVWRRPDLSVESLARMCGSNVPYVINCIKKETGYSANEYINRKRIGYVCVRLQEDPDLSLQEVFFEAGYRVRTTAWRNFRETVGVSPSEYRFSKR